MSIYFEAAANLLPWMIEMRRQVHAHPEVRWSEEGTIMLIKQLNSSSYSHASFLHHDYQGGFVLDVISGIDLPIMAFRADLDALPIQEETGLPFASQVPGVSHACGHDLHIAMVLGVARAVAAGLVKPTHNLRLLFQRAEENPGAPPDPNSGGYYLAQEGALIGVTKLYVLHVLSTLKTGSIYSCEGPIMGNSDRVCVKIKALGGHVAHNADARDVNALRIASECIPMLEAIVNPLAGRNISCEPTGLIAGKGQSSSNIMPSEAEAWLACRTYLGADERTALHAGIKRQISGNVARYSNNRASAEVTVIPGHPATINHGFAGFKSTLEASGIAVLDKAPELGGDDASHLGNYVVQQGGEFVYAFIGAGGEGFADHHTPQFNPDESAMQLGLEAYLALACS